MPCVFCTLLGYHYILAFGMESDFRGEEAETGAAQARDGTRSGRNEVWVWGGWDGGMGPGDGTGWWGGMG